jgi:hypothetical protein
MYKQTVIKFWESVSKKGTHKDRIDKIDLKDWKETTREQISSSLKLTFAFTKGSTDIREVMIWHPFSVIER